jgi:DNA-binding NarL/FixJ family response regulator
MTTMTMILPSRREPRVRHGVGVYLIDDQRLLRAGLTHVMRALGRFEVVGETGDLEQALHDVPARRPDVVVVDLYLDLVTTGEAVELVRSVAPRVPIVVLADREKPCAIHTALSNGARACLSKGADPIELVLAVDAVHRGFSFVSPQLEVCTCGFGRCRQRSQRQEAKHGSR